MTKVLISDFDGTMARQDFYKLVVESLLPPGTPDYWTQYRSGMITHFEALRRYFTAIRASEQEVLRVVDRMELDPGLSTAIELLDQSGWKVVVVSAGCQWYIQRLLSQAKVAIEVHANPGRFEEGKGLSMELPHGSPYLSQSAGIHKAGVVQRYLADGYVVAFAGDGFLDADAARLVSAELRFARADLAQMLRKEGLPFHSFDIWSDIVRVLLQKGA